MLEREAMALLVSALAVNYGRRSAALRRAGSALALAADPYAYADELTPRGAQRLEQAVRERERILEEIERAGVHLVALGEEGYPKRLAQIPQPPHLLYVKGGGGLDEPLPVAIVGTRAASEYGLRHTKAIARDLAQAGACILSGLALGIDAAAHEGALEGGGRTIAVLGGAINCFYPQENAFLRDRMLERGGVIVSEYPMGTSPTRYSFLARNRIIAGLSMGVLVTQGPQRSGASRTAGDAAEYGREVFALPGSVDAPGSALPNRLIAEGAHLVSCAADVLCVLAPQLANQIAARPSSGKPAAKAADAPMQKPAQESTKPEKTPAPLPQNMTDEERRVLTALSGGEMDFDALSEAAGVDAMTLGALLMGLEMDGFIDALPGLRYARRA